MNIVVCNGVWEVVGQTPVCTGTLSSIAIDDIGLSRPTAEDYARIREDALILFAIVFGALVLKKAINF